MKKYEKQSIGLISLKAKIRGLELVSKTISLEALKASGDRRSIVKLKKRNLGVITRHHLAAYALIRKLPFSKVESRCREGNYLDPNRIFKIIEEHAPFASWHDTETNRRIHRKWTIDDVKNCLIRDADVK